MAKRKRGRPLDGWLVLDKPLDMTSTQALGAVKRLLQPQKAGHAGTLDPLATGVLPIALGEATKTVGFAMAGAKRYRFTIAWGRSTDTGDAEGAVIAESAARPAPDAVEAALAGFIGEIDQTPPAYSAIKVDGERAYDLARAGDAVSLAPRRVRIDALDLVAASDAEASLELTCGQGVYVRALARDLADVLGVCGYVSALRRLVVGRFSENQALTLDALTDLSHKQSFDFLLPVETALADIPAVAVTADEAFRLRQGRAIVLLPRQVERLRAAFRPRTINGEDASRMAWAQTAERPVALGEVRAGRFQPVRVFNLMSEP